MTCSAIGKSVQRGWDDLSDKYSTMSSKKKASMWIASSLVGAGILGGGIVLAVLLKNRGFVALGVLGGATGFAVTAGVITHQHKSVASEASRLLRDGEEALEETGNRFTRWATGLFSSNVEDEDPVIAHRRMNRSQYGSGRKCSFSFRSCFPCLGRQRALDSEVERQPLVRSTTGQSAAARAAMEAKYPEVAASRREREAKKDQ